MQRPISKHDRRRGFSLLELVVVLAIVGLALALTGPRLAQLLGAVEFRAKSRELAASISRTRVTAVVEEREIVIPTDPTLAGSFDQPALALDEGWTVSGGPIVFLPTGACTGGTIRISNAKGRTAVYRYAPPRCRPEPIAGT